MLIICLIDFIDLFVLGIDDSKKLDAKKRDSVYADLKTQNVSILKQHTFYN